MKKDVKVIVIKAKAYNGHDRTVQAIVPLDMDVSDVIQMKSIPMLSIIGATVVGPMTQKDAMVYVSCAYHTIFTNPSLSFIKTNLELFAA